MIHPLLNAAIGAGITAILATIVALGVAVLVRYFVDGRRARSAKPGFPGDARNRGWPS